MSTVTFPSLGDVHDDKGLFRAQDLPPFAKSYVLPKVVVKTNKAAKSGTKAKGRDDFKVSMIRAGLDYEANLARADQFVEEVEVQEEQYKSEPSCAGPGALKAYIGYVQEKNYVPIPVLIPEKGVELEIFKKKKKKRSRKFKDSNNVSTEQSKKLAAYKFNFVLLHTQQS